MPANLTPLEPITADVLLTGDPRRAFALAQALLVQPKMSHQARGLWGYTGVTQGGSELGVQSTGVGGPGAAAVLGDLAALGVRRAVRLGSCVSPSDAHPPGQSLLVEAAISRDGTSSSLSGDGHLVLPDAGLLALLSDVAPRVTVSSHDFVARFDPAGPLPDPSATVRDLQTAATFATGHRLGLEVAGLLIVTGPGEEPGLSEAEMSGLFEELGQRVVDHLFKTEA